MEIGRLYPDGSVTDIRTIEPRRCPHFIMVGEHYREDGSCRCNDLTHTEMAEWGYEWRGGLWCTPRESR